MSTAHLNPARERHWVCAQRLRERRLALGLTQREVVARLHRFGSQTTNRALSAMENGRGLDLGLLPELAESLSCSVTYLLGLTTDPQQWIPAQANGNSVESGPVAEQRPRPEAPTVLCSAGILGPDVPAGFTAPGRARRRAGSAVTAAAEAAEEPGA